MRAPTETSGVTATTTTGSSSSVEASLDDLRALAAHLTTLGNTLMSDTATTLSIEFDLPLRGDLLSPATALTCTTASLALGDSLTSLALKAYSLSGLVTATVAAYEAAEMSATLLLAPGRLTAAIAPPLMKAIVAAHTGRPIDPALPGQILSTVIEAVDTVVPGDYDTSVDFIATGLKATPIGIAVTMFMPARPAHTSLVAGPNATAAPPAARTVPETLGRVVKLYEDDSEASHIQVQRVVDPVTGQGHWIAMIPGTAKWLEGHGTVLDGRGNVVAAMGRVSDGERAVSRALHDAMRREGVEGKNEPVMLVGHSQGGMVMTNLAGRRDSGLNVTRVVTMGSPVGGSKVPEGIRTLNIENADDPVKGIDGLKTGDGDPRRVRVSIDDPGSFDGEDGKTDPIGPHDMGRYHRDFVTVTEQTQGDPGHPLTQFTAATEPFFRGEAHTYEYEATRNTPRGEVVGEGTPAARAAIPPEPSAAASIVNPSARRYVVTTP